MNAQHGTGQGWHKSSYSNDTATCVEVGSVGPRALVRDSKESAGATLTFPGAAWDVFVHTTSR